MRIDYVYDYVYEYVYSWNRLSPKHSPPLHLRASAGDPYWLGLRRARMAGKTLTKKIHYLPFPTSALTHESGKPTLAGFSEETRRNFFAKGG